jgi:uncharacterized protein (TIGR03435 family)
MIQIYLGTFRSSILNKDMRPLLLILACSLAKAQTPTFDAATIKPFATPGGRGTFLFGGGRGGPGSSDPGRIHYRGLTLKNLLVNAYDVKDYQISGPDFLNTERFDVEATMPPETTKQQFLIMLQNLLAERFKMTVHHETKELPMYSLVVGKSGPKIKESPPVSAETETKEPAPPPPLPERPKMGADGFPVLPLPSGGRGGMFMMRAPWGTRMMAQRQTIEDLTGRLSTLLSKPVIDATELKAKYDFTLTFSMDGLTDNMPMPPPGGDGGRGGPREMPDIEPPQNLFSAIQSQLGLKLEPKKGNVDLIIVDHAEKTPTEN